MEVSYETVEMEMEMPSFEMDLKWNARDGGRDARSRSCCCCVDGNGD